MHLAMREVMLAMRRHFKFFGALSRLALPLAIVLRVSAARAEEPDSTSPPPASVPPPQSSRPAVGPDGAEAATEWYGWQTLLADGAAVTFTVMAAKEPDSTPFLMASAGTYLLGGPIVHAAHGNWGRAAGSLGLRLGLPLAGGLAGAALAQCRQGEWFCGYAEVGMGTLIGIVAAVTIDASVLAREPVTKAPALVPAVSVGRDRAWAGVSGTF